MQMFVKKMKSKESLTIYYFSATGNSMKLSLDLASYFPDSKLINIATAKVVEHPTSLKVGFIFPVYMGGLPKIVDHFLKNFPFEKDIYYFSIGTYYTYKGCAIPIVNKIMLDKGVSLNYGNYLPTVGNCLMEYEVTERKRTAILKRVEGITLNLVSDIKNNLETTPSRYCRLLEKFHKWLFNIFFAKAYKKFALEDNCINCGICRKICPTNNITLEDNKLKWGTSCEACHACVHWCPQNAINLGKSKGRLPYQNPAITRAMLLRSNII